MLPMNHHKTRSQSSPRTPKHGCQPSGLPRFTIEDALLQVTLGELKTREAIRIVISLAANDCLTQESSESLGAIATEAGYSKDPDRYLSLYKALLAETDAFKSWKDDALQAKYDEISKRYPQYSDFDVLGVRPYVLYPSAAGSFSYDDLAGFYSDIVRFVAILKASNEHWKNVGGLTAQELQHLEKYVRRLKDTKFKLRLRRAIEDFYTWRSGREQANDGSSDAFDRNGYVVSRVRHFAENRYGVRLKDTNEFGLYGFFVHDNPAPNGDVDISYSYYRSDPSFEKEIWLDVDGAVYDYFDGSGE